MDSDPDDVKESKSVSARKGHSTQSLKRVDTKLAVHTSSSFNEAATLIAKLNISVSELEMIKCPKLHGAFRTNMRILFGLHSYMRKAEFECRERQLYKYCLTGSKDKHELHKSRVMGMKIIHDIILRASSNFITAPHVVTLVWSFMSCMHHFQLRLKSGKKGIVQRTRMKTAEKCINTFAKLIEKFELSLYRVVLSSILTFYRVGRMWEFEFACKDMILDLLAVDTNVDESIIYILDTAINVAKEDFAESRHLFEILYDILRKLQWRTMSTVLMGRFLAMFESSIVPKPTDEIDFAPLRKTLELCIRNAIENFDNPCLLDMVKLCLSRLSIDEPVDDQISLDIGNLAAYAASRYKVKTYSKSISTNLIFSICEVYNKRKSTGLVIAIRLWRNLIDRNRNVVVFKNPRIFFRGCNYKLKIPKRCSTSDKKFFKALRQMSYEVLMDCFQQAENRWHLELLYQLISITLVEIPCGYTASSQVVLLMSLQDYAFHLSRTNLIKSHYIHAIVLSIMSLICYVKNADILFKHVIDITDRRAEWAPHLNPPLRHEYEYAEHHTLWNKPNLFFQDWEVSYGLWKCYREKSKLSETKNLTFDQEDASRL